MSSYKMSRPVKTESPAELVSNARNTIDTALAYLDTNSHTSVDDLSVSIQLLMSAANHLAKARSNLE